MIDALLGWLQSTFWFIRKDAYPDFDKFMEQARLYAADPISNDPPKIPKHRLRRNWGDKVLTGEDE